MAIVPKNSLLHRRWRHGAARNVTTEIFHGGPAQPNCVVEVRRGRMQHHWTELQMLDGSYPKFGRLIRNNQKRWQAYWQPDGDWIQVPNVQSVEFDQALETFVSSSGGGSGTSGATASGTNGLKTATILIDNVVLKEVTATVGTYHLIKRGYLSPWLGWYNVKRSHLWQGNEWLNILNGSYQVRVKMGYGDTIVPVFGGLIDDCDYQTNPDQLTVTATDFGQLFVLQDLLGNNKEPTLQTPIYFADRRSEDDVREIASGYAASSHKGGHRPHDARSDDASAWVSAPQANPTWVEWVEIHVPQGRYEEIYVETKGNDYIHDMWVSFYVRPDNRKTACRYNDAVIPTDQWLDLGAGDVPDPPTEANPTAHGGYPFVKHFQGINGDGRKFRIGKLECGDNTQIRVAFAGYGRAPGEWSSETQPAYAARIQKFVTYSRTVKKSEARSNEYVLVDDLSDVARFVFMWAGFKEWEIEDTGVSLQFPHPFNQSDSLMDILSWCGSQVDWCFFMQDPTDDDLSIGVPTFRKVRASKPPRYVQEQITDANLILGDQGKFTKDQMPEVIFYRGNTKKWGVTLGQDQVRRAQARYYPPWSTAAERTGDLPGGIPHKSLGLGRNAGVLKYEVVTDANLQTRADVEAAARLLAYNMGLSAFTAELQIAAFPGLNLDSQISVIDAPTALNTRLWISRIQRKWVMTEKQTQFMDTLAGALIDSPDLTWVMKDLRDAMRRRRNQYTYDTDATDSRDFLADDTGLQFANEYSGYVYGGDAGGNVAGTL